MHFAAKYGHVAMVQLLANEPVVEKNRLNKEGKKAVDIVCTRSGSSEDKKKILECLKGFFLRMKLLFNNEIIRSPSIF